MRYPVAALTAALLISTVAPGPAMAECNSSDRIVHREAECLHAWKKRKPQCWWGPVWACFLTEVSVRNECPDLGRVVAKVDLKDAEDMTIYLPDGHTWRESTLSEVRDIYCCSDLGHCNRPDEAERQQ